MPPVDKYNVSEFRMHVKCNVRQVYNVGSESLQCKYIVNILISLDKTM